MADSEDAHELGDFTFRLLVCLYAVPPLQKWAASVFLVIVVLSFYFQNQRLPEKDIMIVPDKINILYLEDDPDSVELVKFSLNLAGLGVTAVESGDAFMRLAQEGDFDLFLMDGLIPSGYSFELCPKLRHISPKTPIVFYTALGFPTEVQQGAEAGADAYLVKPFMGDLAETLLRVINESRSAPLTLGSTAAPCCGVAP